MTNPELKKPDYKVCAKSDTWSIKDFAMLLHRIDPIIYKSVRFDHSTPPGFEEAKTTYILLSSIPWSKRYGAHFQSRRGGNPLIFIHEAINKDIPMPAPLRKSIMKRYQDEIGKIIKGAGVKSTPVGNRERNNFLKVIGILIAALIDEKAKSARNSKVKISALKVSELIMDKAQELEIDEEGLKSINRKVTQAIDLINQDSNAKLM